MASMLSFFSRTSNAGEGVCATAQMAVAEAVARLAAIQTNIPFTVEKLLIANLSLNTKGGYHFFNSRWKAEITRAQHF
jgi:hypothetical protein